MNSFFGRWLLTALAVGIATQLTGMRCDGIVSLLAASLLLGMVNASVKPALLELSLPFIVLSLGFFIPVLNGLLLWLVGSVVPGFHVDGFWQAFWGSIIVSIASGVLGGVFRARPSESEHAQPARSWEAGGEKTVQGRVVK